MNNISLLIAYDGSDFFGWQKTRMGPSVESTLQLVLEKILQHPIQLQAASRTDRGVHAEGQVVNFFTEKTLHTDFIKSINALLPKSITVLQLKQAPPEFHPTLLTLSKTYAYQICYGSIQLPQHRFFSWHVPYELDLEAMRKGSQLLIGEHDFSAFCNMRKNLNYEDRRRTLFSLDLHAHSPNRLRIEVCGNHFLYKMVRNLVGTLVHVGRHKIPFQKISEILESKSRPLAGVTAPAHGLTLREIFYPETYRMLRID